MWRDERSIFNQQIYLLYWGNWRRGRPSMAGNLLKRHLKLLECDRIWEKPVYVLCKYSFEIENNYSAMEENEGHCKTWFMFILHANNQGRWKTSFQSTISSASFYSLSVWSQRQEAEASISEIISERLWVQLDTLNKIPGHQKAKNIMNVTNGQW